MPALVLEALAHESFDGGADRSQLHARYHLGQEGIDLVAP